jgi:hypothetical protein
MVPQDRRGQESPVFSTRSSRSGVPIDQRHSLGDADVIRRLLAAAGFDAIRIETVAQTIRMSDVFARLNAIAIVGMSAAAKSMSDEQRAQVVAAIANDSI